MKILFDIGGTHMRVAGSKDGKSFSPPIVRETPQNFDEAVILFEEIVKEVSGEEKIESIAGGLAGVIKDGVVIHSPNLPEWDGNNFVKVIQGKFSDVSVVVKNDADVACLGEAYYGAGKGYNIVVYFTISTGIGGARVVDGNIDTHSYGFEPGWQILNLESKENFEELASGGAVYEKIGRKYKDLSSDELDVFAEKLAIGFHNSILHWSPDIVVLGGAVIIDTPELVGLIEKKLQKIMKIFPEIPLFRGAELGDFPTLWGALKLP